MRPSVSFAAGLWLGGLVVLAGGALLFQLGVLHRRETASLPIPTVSSGSAELDRLRQENAWLTAEAQRLRQTVAELKDQLEEPPAFRPRRRSPVPRPSEEPARAAPALPPAPDATEAATAGQLRAMLDQLTARAEEGDLRALEGLTALADRGGAVLLVRLWNSGLLPVSALPTAARCLGNVVEVSPGAGEALRALFTDPQADESLVRAALEGMLTPPAGGENGAPAPSFNALGRLEFLEQTAESAGSEPVRDLLETAIDHLTRMVESTAPAQ